MPNDVTQQIPEQQVLAEQLFEQQYLKCTK